MTGTCLVPSGTTPTSSFIQKLYELVTNEDDDIIAFLPDGKKFEVKDPSRMESTILPR